MAYEEECQCPCCCSSITIFDNPRLGGLHPDRTKRCSQTLNGDTDGKRWQVITPSIHLLGGTFFAPKSNRGDEIFVELFSEVNASSTIEYDPIYTFSLEPGESHAMGDEITGARFDFGLFANVIGLRELAGEEGGRADRVMLNLTYIERKFYTPAFYDEDRLLQHYWSCVRGDVPLWSGFDTGSENEDWEEEGGGGDSGYGIDPGTKSSDLLLMSQVGDLIYNQSGLPIETNY